MFTSTIPTNPNQTFTVSVNGMNFMFTIMLYNDVSYCSITSGDGTVLCQSNKICANCFILNKAFESQYGNFVFESVDGSYPTFRNFNVNSELTYFTPEEMSEMRSKYAYDIEAGSINNHILQSST